MCCYGKCDSGATVPSLLSDSSNRLLGPKKTDTHLWVLPWGRLEFPPYSSCQSESTAAKRRHDSKIPTFFSSPERMMGQEGRLEEPAGSGCVRGPHFHNCSLYLQERAWRSEWSRWRWRWWWEQRLSLVACHVWRQQRDHPAERGGRLSTGQGIVCGKHTGQVRIWDRQWNSKKTNRALSGRKGRVTMTAHRQGHVWRATRDAAL